MVEIEIGERLAALLGQILVPIVTSILYTEVRMRRNHARHTRQLERRVAKLEEPK